MKKVLSLLLSFTFLLGILLGFPTNVSAQTKNSIPNKILVGYWHNFDNGSGSIKLRDVSENWDVINLSFGEPTTVTSGDIQFTPFNASIDEFKEDVKYLQSKGKKVLLSIGGQNGQVQLVDKSARDNFVRSVSSIIDTYGLDGLDIDFEGHSLYLNPGDKDFKNPTTPVITNLISALKELTSKYGKDFILTMAPETFFVQLGHTYYGGLNSYVDKRAGSYLPVIHAMRNELDWLQVQYYNSGPINDINGKMQTMGSAEFYVSLVDMLLTGFNINKDSNYFFPPLREDQVVIGVPSSSNAGNGWVSNLEVEKALTALTQGGTVGGYTIDTPYSNLRGLMSWSINWDQYTNFSWSNHFRNYFDKFNPPIPTEPTLQKATLETSSNTSNNFILTGTIPKNNTATTYKLFEGSKEIKSGTLEFNKNTSQTIKIDINNKEDGIYEYYLALYDNNLTEIKSNAIKIEIDSTTIPEPNEWKPYKAYEPGDIVIYSGIEYTCRQPHTSLPGWEPNNVPALWLRQ